MVKWWWASLPAPDASGPGQRRPTVVIQSNPFNESRIATVVVATITSNLALAQARGNVRVSRNQSGLPRPSVVNVSQIYTIDRIRLTARVKALPPQVMQRVDDGVKLVLGL